MFVEQPLALPGSALLISVLKKPIKSEHMQAWPQWSDGQWAMAEGLFY